MCLVFLQKNEHLFNGLFDNNNMSIDEGDEHMDDSFINKIKEADGYKKNKDWSNAARKLCTLMKLDGDMKTGIIESVFGILPT